MGFLLALSRAIDALTRFIGHNVRWLILAAVLVSAINAIIRKTFDTSSNAWLELQWLLFGAVFMLAAAYTLQQNAHVRIDVISNRLSKRTRDKIDAVCHVIMLGPIAAILIWLSTGFFWDSYMEGEMSSNAGGLPVWPGKLIILVGFTLLLLQMFSETVKRIAVLSGAISDPEPQPVHGHAPGDTSVSGGHNE
jgi:TRAP-type mannitol/chloroaromatic compound transport system permease small subunit